MGKMLLKEKLWKKILLSDTEKYNLIVIVIKESKYIFTLLVTELINALQAFQKILSSTKEKLVKSLSQSKFDAQS